MFDKDFCINFVYREMHSTKTHEMIFRAQSTLMDLRFTNCKMISSVLIVIDMKCAKLMKIYQLDIGAVNLF